MAEEQTFEQALAELEQVVRDLEGDATGLEDSLAKYEAGVGLLKFCYARLRHAEQRILQLTGESDDGQPQTTPFRHSAAAVEPDRSTPKRRRKADDGLY
jgi:exodeoxyribonuclease VII small subunit